MRAENRRIGSELKPAQKKFRIVVSALMTAEIVPPIIVENIARITCEEDFIPEHRPSGPSVAGETDWVSVRAKPAPTMIDHRSEFRTILLHILEESVIAPKSLAQSPGALCRRIVLIRSVLADGKCLLPVQPPEIDAFSLVRTDDILEESLHESVVLHLPQNGLSGIVAKVGSHRSIVIFVSSHAVGGMQIEGSTDSMLMHIVD